MARLALRPTGLRLAVEQRLALGLGLGGYNVPHVGIDGVRRRLRRFIDHELNFGLRHGGRDRIDDHGTLLLAKITGGVFTLSKQVRLTPENSAVRQARQARHAAALCLIENKRGVV
jgi:hypothetical protein